jgi:small-conductance mechanosensitive channel
LFAWTRVENFLTASSDLNVAIHEVVHEMGFEIAIPRREVRIRGEKERIGRKAFDD